MRVLGWVAALAVALWGLVTFARVFTWAMDTQSYNTWGAMFMVPVVIALNGVLIAAAAKRQGEAWFTRLLVTGFLLKLAGISARYIVAYYLYGGQADAEAYNLFAIGHYLDWRQGDIWWEASGKVGTLNMELITTALYVVIGPSVITAFFVFGSLAFWGVYLIYRAFRVALPQADHKRYALLVFLLPTILYWPSSIGKEAWLMLFVGVTAYGAARFFNHALATGLALIALGAAGTALIRPHITVLMVAALFVAQVVRPTTKRSTSILTKAAGVFVMGVAAVILVSASAQFLGIDDLSAQAVADRVEDAGGQTAQGGSAFTPVPLESPLGVPAAIVTLLFRPFPWEANGLPMLVQSAEGLVLLVLTVAAWPRLKALPTLLRRNPYLVFAVVYALAFILAFSGFANFGILARQRVLMVPFFLVLLALPRPLPKSATKKATRDATRKELVGAHAW
ncbi:hypothetical protein J4N02_07385 [Propioniciclava sp. MC1595]|uniref:hypothetical protein n=1 Tax=Propioniciclava sp. MC1595 TaxID=2760308 RepID=UPI00166272BE|nr:hypothetical protein [Propioniciclava sp. MC1595]MBB1494618.1 hypothetical protein [Propioniciclava sp. MC1595]QTE27390.1 hypothetical protein J4N02_07385 [Propioniciclava sp. MC1595]